MIRKGYLIAAATVAACLAGMPAQARNLEQASIKTFVDTLVAEHGFDAAYVRDVLRQSESKQNILDAMSRPAEKVLSWQEYRKIFLTPERISAGVQFWREHETRLASIAERTGVPAKIITAIVGVETFYGTRTGGYRVIDALSTLGFDYPPRASFFRGELEQLFLLSREENLDINAMTGSYAGAMGPPQFIPSSYRAYAIDGDGDGQRDLINNWDDILGSVANYFVEHKWRAGEPVAAPATLGKGASGPDQDNSFKLSTTIASLHRDGVKFTSTLAPASRAGIYRLQGASGPEHWVGFNNLYVITRYNRSVMYAMAVHQLSVELEQAFAAAQP